MKQYSTDLREAVCQACDAGASATEVARLFGVSRRSIDRWRAAKRDTGSAAAPPRSGRPPLLNPDAAAAFAAQVLAHPEATLAEHAARWEAEQGVRLSTATVSRLLARQRITRKKRRWSPASRILTSAPPGRPSSPSWTPAS